MSQPPNKSAPHDKHFYDSFLVVVAILAGVALVLILVSRMIATATQDQYVLQDEKLRVATEERLAPIGKVAVSGADNSAVEEPAKEAKPVVAQDLGGEQVFNTACVACHGQGIAGAPKFGDKAAWAPRIAQGMPTLFEHALKGFQGKTGLMPAKGARADLSDKSISNAVEYMVKAAK